MKKILQFLDYEFPVDGLIGWKKFADKIIFIPNADAGDPEIPLVMGANLTNTDH